MLSLSKKFFNQTDYLSEGYKVAFNPNKDKLTFYKAEKANKKITDLQKITDHVNKLQKPIFSEINPYRNCYKKLKEINVLIKGESRDVINLEAFNENFKPSSAELKELVWAVHATNILPEDNSITAVSVNALTQEIILGVTNTTHFALGELVKPHHGFSWEDRSYAVITPLGSIMDQAVNLFAQDTFIAGKWNLKKESIVLIPQGTDTSKLKDNPFEFVYYSPSEKSLRAAIDEVILSKGGITFRMQGNIPALGSYVLLDEEININTPSFFESLLKEKQGSLSFGDHTHSEIGDAAIFGILRQVLNNLLTANSDISLNTSRKALAYVSHRIASIFYSKVKKYFTLEEQVNIENLLSTQKVPRDFDDPLWTEISSELFAMLNHKELQEFKTTYPEFFDGQPNEFEAAWAISRWFSVGHKQGLKEGLPEIINSEISKFIQEDPKSFYLFFTCSIIENFRVHKNIYSSRLEVVKEIVNLESFEMYRNTIKSFTPEAGSIEEFLQEAVLKELSLD